ncbi:MAG: hypothetical protein QF384_02315 [Alphaproteobacteria bacterium]|jgi:hypothetical protein|nr:hypothetical protein [Alphaproteobacteria bacterium]MDP6829352.1 hypothetical protein [Alphaproteobacteria bacterium]MDP6875631.1 hypothetical protein [Alphaproteobacteria bacterium]
MTSANDALILDLVQWVAQRPRPYDEVMEAWRTSCPRLTIWEDAVERKLLRREIQAGKGAMVRITPSGLAFLSASGRDVAIHEAN